MKQCPVCKSTYTDDSLVFCLNDGGKLFSPAASAATREMRFDERKTLSGAGETAENYQSVPTIAVQKRRKSLNLIIILLVFGFIASVMGAIAVTRYFVLKRNAEREEILKSGQTPADERNSAEAIDSKEKSTEAEKQNERRKAANKTPAPVVSESDTSAKADSVSTAVDSPNDGFLALRSEPDHKTGAQLLRIPHKTVIYVYNCQNTTAVGERRGRWCETTYGGKTGWVFDGFLLY